MKRAEPLGESSKPAGVTTAIYSPAKLAREVGISTDALRFYERKGLLPSPPRGSSGRRVYSASALKRVRMIRSALSLGFTVAELREVFRTRDSGGSPCQTVCNLAEEKLRHLEQTVAHLCATRDLLASSLKKWRRRVAANKQGRRMGLLEMFAEAHPERSRQISPRLGPGLRDSRLRKTSH